MTDGKMHADEVDIDTELVRRLVAAQFPRWAELPIEPIRSTGTVNAIYRLGENFYVRLPRVREWAGDLDTEFRWLPRLAPRLSLQIPEPIGKGEPGEGFPFSWAIYRWIEGQPYSDELIGDEHRAAGDLAQFVAEMRRIEPMPDAPHGGREPLRRLDADTRAVSRLRERS